MSMRRVRIASVRASCGRSSMTPTPIGRSRRRAGTTACSIRGRIVRCSWKCSALGGELSAADNNGMFWLGLAAIVSTSTVYRTFNMGESFKTKLFLLFILTGMLIAFFEPQKANGGAKTPVGESREEKVTGGMSSGAPNWQNAGSAGNDSDESDIETF